MKARLWFGIVICAMIAAYAIILCALIAAFVLADAAPPLPRP